MKTNHAPRAPFSLQVMADLKLRIYHALPVGLRSLAATVRGYQLRSWRYGPETERLVREAHEREHWSPAQWRSWQDERLREILHRAVHRVPWYREHWAGRRRKGDNASWEDLANWPVVEKDTVRAQARAFLADDCDPKKMFSELTSGSTNKPLDIWWSRQMCRDWFALFEARWRNWYGVNRHDRWAIVGGKLVTPVTQRKPPFWVWNGALNQLYLSGWHIAPDLVDYYADAMLRYRVSYIYGYPSSLYHLALGLLKAGRTDVRMKVAIANAEPVFEYQRRAIQEAFHCHLRETYGMAEAIAGASECEAGQLHLWPDLGQAEILHGNDPAPAGEIGDVVGTSLINRDNIFIRYRVGDQARFPVETAPCPCGRALPRLAAVEGRIDDVFFTVDGRRVGRVGPVFSAALNIIEGQAVQEKLDFIRIRFVPAPEYTEADGQRLIERLRERLGPVRVQLEAVDRIPRGPNGKFRSILCQLPPEEIRRLEAGDAVRNNRVA
jgi:phenylacetate-CoA ligase